MAERDRYLATTEWQAAHLGDPSVRILECTVFLRPNEAGKPGYTAVSGSDEWAEGHIPRSVYADLSNDLSDRAQALRLMMPSAHQFAEAMERHGVGDESAVVVYDRQGNMWAARTIGVRSNGTGAQERTVGSLLTGERSEPATTQGDVADRLGPVGAYPAHFPD